MTAATFELTSRRHDLPDQPPRAVVHVAGEIDIASAAAFTEAVAEQSGPRPLILDLTQLRYIDSAGLAALDRLLRQRAVTVVIAPGSPTRTAAELVGTPLHDSVEEALRQRTA